jgi:hypothetical protein
MFNKVLDRFWAPKVLTVVTGLVVLAFAPAAAAALGAFVLALGLGALFGAVVLGTVSDKVTGRVSPKLVVGGTVLALVAVGLMAWGVVGVVVFGAALSTWLLGFGLGTVFADRF